MQINVNTFSTGTQGAAAGVTAVHSHTSCRGQWIQLWPSPTALPPSKASAWGTASRSGICYWGSPLSELCPLLATRSTTPASRTAISQQLGSWTYPHNPNPSSATDHWGSPPTLPFLNNCFPLISCLLCKVFFLWECFCNLWNIIFLCECECPCVKCCLKQDLQPWTSPFLSKWPSTPLDFNL